MTTLTRTEFIDYTRAQTLIEVVRTWTSSHSVIPYESFVAAVRQSGLRTCLLPYKESKRSKKLTLKLFICPAISFEGNSETKYEAHPTHYYTSIDVLPMNDYINDLWQINLKHPWFAVNAGIDHFQFLLSKTPPHSSKSGRGFAHAENLGFFIEQFLEDWPQGTDKIIEPKHEFDLARCRWEPVVFNPDM